MEEMVEILSLTTLMEKWLESTSEVEQGLTLSELSGETRKQFTEETVEITTSSLTLQMSALTESLSEQIRRLTLSFSMASTLKVKELTNQNNSEVVVESNIPWNLEDA